MGWASLHVAALARGQTVSFRPRGHSMRGRIASGALVTVAPLGGSPPVAGEVVLCTLRGGHLLHLVKAVRGDQVLIGNNVGKINGWIHLRAVHGRCVRVEP